MLRAFLLPPETSLSGGGRGRGWLSPGYSLRCHSPLSTPVANLADLVLRPVFYATDFLHKGALFITKGLLENWVCSLLPHGFPLGELITHASPGYFEYSCHNVTYRMTSRFFLLISWTESPMTVPLPNIRGFSFFTTLDQIPWPNLIIPPGIWATRLTALTGTSAGATMLVSPFAFLFAHFFMRIYICIYGAGVGCVCYSILLLNTYSDNWI